MTRVAAWCLFLGYAIQCVAAEPNDFRFHKDVDRGKAAQERIVAVAFDADVYAATRDGFPDLRVFDGQGQETPFLIEKAVEPRTHVVRTACGSRVVSLRQREDGLELLVQLQDNAPAADGLTIRTPLVNYERRVSILGSKDGTAWTPLVQDGLIFDYSRYMDIGNRELRLPKNDCRQLKVMISGISDTKESPFLELTRKYRGGDEAERIEKTVLERRPFRMDSVKLWCERSKKLSEHEKKTDYPVVEYRVEENAAEKTTVVYVRTRREPLTEFSLETPSRNFSRAARVQMPVKRGVRTEWVDIGRGKVSLVDFGGYHSESLGISFPQRRESEYRIVIHNEDSPPLKVTGVKARGNVYRAIFLADDKKAYHLCYGSEAAEPPKYDAAAVLGPLQLRGNQPTEGRLGKEVSSAAAGQSFVFTMRGILNNVVFLGAVIVMLVVVFSWALFRAIRRINELPKDDY